MMDIVHDFMVKKGKEFKPNLKEWLEKVMANAKSTIFC